jgi:hypothetical protein
MIPYVSRRIRENIDRMKVDRLMRGSRYKIAAKVWLHDHGIYEYTAKQQSYPLRSPTARGPALAEELTEVIRNYPPKSGATAAQAESTFHMVPPGTAVPIPMIELDFAPEGESRLLEEE